MKVLVIDNYDSFVYNLVQYVGELGANPVVFRNDQISLIQVKKQSPDRIIISPGPGSPDNKRYFGICSDIIRETGPKTPLLGVCLGHQGIIQTFGGKINRATRQMHGKTSLVKHNGRGIFRGVKNPIVGARYHSLVGNRESIPKCLEVSAESLDDREVMAVRHVNYPINGIQFHPESILTSDGKSILKNFLDGIE
jgi:anthranilate synthase component 2